MRSLKKPLATPLLATKLRIPQARSGLVSRPRLIERLNAGFQTKLTLISAPAGFGKTTLLSEWVKGCGQPVAWLSLDKGDNDPISFLSYLTAVLQTVRPDVGRSVEAALKSPQSPPIQGVLATLISEITTITEGLVLVLDDCHVIGAQPVHDAIAFLIEHQPPHTRLLIASRVDLPLPLARLRAGGQMIELRAADLRFTRDEAAAFLNRVMGLSLSDTDVQTLEARTEGWIAGLQMAALSMQGREDVGGFITAFTGSHRYILDYLTQEVLDQQTERVRSFLLRTSILDRLSGPVCNAVTGREDGQELLEYLDRANLFVVPLDDERTWYRYHSLFADLLLNRLKQTQPDQVPGLHNRASQWCEAHLLIAEAVSHALASGDVERAARLVEDNAFTVMGKGELTTVLGWLDELPKEVVRSRPWLSVSHAWALMHAGQLSGVEPRLQDAEKASDGKGQKMKGYIAAMRAYVAACRGEIAQGVEFARQALDQLSEPDLMARSFTAAMLSSLYRFNGDFVASTQAIAEAISISRQLGDGPMIVLASCNLAATLILQGQPRQAAATFRGVMRLAEDFAGHGASRLPYTGLASTGLATVHREWNELETAAYLAREGVELSKQWGHAEVIMHGYVELAQVLQACGDEEGALDALQRAMRTARDLSSWTSVSLSSTQARLHLAQGNLAAAARWAQERELTLKDEIGFQCMADCLTLARVLIAQDRLDEASMMLKRLLNVAEPAGAVGYVIEILVLQAVVEQAQDAPDFALKRLAQALALAEPEGYVRTFVDAGAPMAALLRLAAARNLSPHYVHELLAAFADWGLGGPEKEVVRNRQLEIVEPLSERELEVLRLIAAGLSNRQIANELWLAVGTVKKHTNNIYGKLGVRSRVQAIMRAKELHLIPHQ